MLNINSWEVGIRNVPCQKRARELSLFSFWVNLWLSKWILLKRLFYSEGWIQKMGIRSNVFWRGAATINESVQFLKEVAPHTKHLCRARLCKKMQSRWRSAPRKPQQCAWAPPSIPRNDNELFASTRHSHPRESPLLGSGSLLTFMKTIDPEDLGIVTHETPQQHFFWVLLWVFGHVGNQERVKSGESYMLHEACRSGLTLECNWSQALTLNLEIQS